MRKLVRRCAAVMSFALAAVQGVALYTQAILPDQYYVAAGSQLELSAPLPITVQKTNTGLPVEVYSAAGNSYPVELRLPGGVMIKQVQVQVIDREMVIPGGNAFGIKMFTEGVIVVGMSDISCGGEGKNPAKTAGIRVGDILLSVNGEEVRTNEDVGEALSHCKGEAVKVQLSREGKEQTVELCPVRSDDGAWRAGIWVRDSSAGIGTMTYYDPARGVFAGLGHAICDVDTGDIMPLHSGEIVDVRINGVHKGESGVPGELRGSFTGKGKGDLLINSQVGIFGKCEIPELAAQAVPAAMRYEVKEGPATIRCTLDDGGPKEYEVYIEKVSIAQDHPTKNMVLRVTDEELLEKTGGIVQGMSGSPILQNGKLIGAVTHVFVSDPTRGYGIFVENMRQMSKSV